MFNFFSYNVHNYLVDSSAFVSVILLLVANKTNEKWAKIDALIIQLDKSFVHATSELQNVLMRLSSKEQVHHV